MSASKDAGDRGEAMTARYLRGLGYEILASQYRCRYGEIDLIAKKGGLLCFVEVKLRSGTRCGLPREAVTAAKQRRIRTTAAYYMAENGDELNARFDVSEVYDDAPGGRIVYLEDAFQ